MKCEILFDNGSRRWVGFGRDPEKPESIIDTNEYLITHNGRGLLLDPGGTEIFPEVVTAISQVISLEDIDSIFGSHQDPDIVSSLAFWANLCNNLTVYVPWVWEGFISHFSKDQRLTPIPDEGMTLPLNGASDLKLIPAHYCHSSGNFSLYDSTAKILFSGDIGAALLPQGETDLFVRNFDDHIQYMEGFHLRWMPSNRAKNAWIARVRDLEVNMICPQHGSIFKGEDVKKFLDWFESLQVGQAV